MARPLRIEYPGAVYHVMARGNHGQKIYRDDADRKLFLETLGEACHKTGWQIHAYVLMGNHYHLLLGTPEANLVVGMKWLQSTYTSRYNSRHAVSGHLFQGRYKAVLVEDKPNYLQVVSTYIHLNPARAHLIKIGPQRLRSYGWSSYPAYVRPRADAVPWLVRQRVLGSLGLGPTEGNAYEAYLESRVLELGTKAGRKELEKEWKALRRGWYLGTESFRDKLAGYLERLAKGRRRQSHSGPARVAHDEKAAETALDQALKALGLNAKRLAPLPKGAPEKTVLAWWLRRRSTVSLRWVSERLEMGHYTRVTQAVSRMGRRPPRKWVALRRRLMQLEETLTDG
jgi:REP element-mobilizing transposase RayT